MGFLHVTIKDTLFKYAKKKIEILYTPISRFKGATTCYKCEKLIQLYVYIVYYRKANFNE